MSGGRTTPGKANKRGKANNANKAWVALLRTTAENVGFHKLRDGAWLGRVAAIHVRRHCERVTPESWDKRYPGLGVEDRAARQISRAARRAATAGAIASVGASTGELLSLMTEGLGAPVGVPAAILSMAAEAARTAVVDVELVCDLASIYGVPFDPDDVGEIATLLGLALDVDLQARVGRSHESPEAPDGLVAQLIELQEGEVATRIGRVMLEESLVKNVVPVLGVAISARWNFVSTQRVGAEAKQYMRYRAALRQAVGDLKLGAVSDPATVIEGAWLLATADGQVKHEETMAIAGIVAALFQSRYIEIDTSLGTDEEEWFAALPRTPPETRRALLDVLYLVAATDRHVQESERRFLRRVGKALSIKIDFDRIDTICRHLDRGDPLPSDFFHCSENRFTHSV
jgi:uncharacterized tellurite resistance protein B-like protein